MSSLDEIIINTLTIGKPSVHDFTEQLYSEISYFLATEFEEAADLCDETHKKILGDLYKQLIRRGENGDRFNNKS